jgi:flagellum-specific ATP synthase
VLSRSLADSGHYPAIDIEQSISRVMHAVTDESHVKLAKQFKTLLSRYQRNRDLINVGAYAAGSDPVLDKAIMLYPQLEAFLQQGRNDFSGHMQSVAQLRDLMQLA